VTVALALAVGVAGCGKKEEAPAKPKKKALSELLDAEKPGLFGPFKTVKFGASLDDVKEAFPKYFEDPSTYGKTLVGRGDIDGYETDISASIELEGGLSSVSVDLPKEEALALLKEKWGDGEQVKLGRDDVTMWVDEGAGIRAAAKATYDEAVIELEVTQFTSYKAIAEKGTDTIAFKPQDVLGKTAADLLKAFPQYVSEEKDSAGGRAADKMMKGLENDLKATGINVKNNRPKLDVSLPGTKYDDSSTLVVLHFDDDGTVRSYTVMVEFEGKKEAGELVTAAFDEIWGKSITMKLILQDGLFWYDADKGIRVSARVKDDQVDLEFVKYQPIDKFFGEAKDQWGWETTKVLGASADELQKAYGARCKIKENKKFGSLHLEKTDYQDNVGGTLVHLVFDADAKVKSYSFSLRYKKFDGAKEKFMGLLKSKFGEGKPAEKDYLKRTQYSAAPKVLMRDSSITKSLDIEVSVPK